MQTKFQDQDTFFLETNYESLGVVEKVIRENDCGNIEKDFTDLVRISGEIVQDKSDDFLTALKK